MTMWTSRRAAHPASTDDLAECRAPHSRPDTGFGSPSANRRRPERVHVERSRRPVGRSSRRAAGPARASASRRARRSRSPGRDWGSRARGQGWRACRATSRRARPSRPPRSIAARRRTAPAGAPWRSPAAPTPDPPSRRTAGPRRPASARAGAPGRRAPGGGIRPPRRSSSASSREQVAGRGGRDLAAERRDRQRHAAPTRPRAAAQAPGGVHRGRHADRPARRLHRRDRAVGAAARSRSPRRPTPPGRRAAPPRRVALQHAAAADEAVGRAEYAAGDAVTRRRRIDPDDSSGPTSTASRSPSAR